jgi:hypothetical protein
VCVVEISVITKLAPARVLLHRFLPTALAGGQLLCGARQSSGIASLIRLLGRDENAGVHKPQEGMMEIELVRESWGENENKGDRWIDLYVGADGPVRLSHLRPSPKGSSAEDYEYHVSVAAAAVPKLVFALLREKYLGRSDAVHEFREFCEKEGIELWW